MDANVCPRGTERIKGKCVTTRGHWYRDKRNNIVLLDNDFGLIKVIKDD